MKKVIVTNPFTDIRDRIIDICVDKMQKGKGFLYILPSRESIFEVRDKLMNRYKGIVNSSVVTFYDLEEKNFNLIKGEISSISDVEAKIILKKSLMSVNLSYFQKIKDTDGFTNQIFSTIKKLKRNLIKPEDRDNFIFKLEDTILKKKFEDIFKVYEKYEELKGELPDVDDISIVSSEMISEKLLELVDIIIIDGYINIDPVDYKLIDNLLNIYKGDVVVSVPFANDLVLNFIQSEIIDPFKDRGFDIELNMECLPKNINEDLVLKFGTGDSSNYNLSDSIIIKDSPCMEDEVRMCGRFIKDKLNGGKFSPEEIVIAVNDEDYQRKLLEVFEEYGIPLCVPNTVKLTETGLFKEILSIINLENKNSLEFRSILNSPFFTKDINAYNILQSLNFDINNYAELINNEEITFSREEVNQAFDLYEKVKLIIENKKGMDVIDFIKYSLEALEVEENILDISVSNLKAYLAITSLIDEIKLMRDRWELKLSHRDFLDILVDGASFVNITIKKSKQSGIKVFNTDHFKGNKYKIVCALGLNEGVIPAIIRGNSILTSRDRENLRKDIALLAPSFELMREKIRFSIMLSGASECLYLSCLTSRDSGEYMIKSPYLSEVLRIIGCKEDNPKRTMRDRFNISNVEVASLREASFYCNINNLDGFNLKHFRSEDYNPINSIKEIGDMDISPRKIESYSKCPYRFFVEDVLKLGEYDADSFIEGNICHYVLSQYYKSIDDKKIFMEDQFQNIFNMALDNYNVDSEGLVKKKWIEDLKEIIRSFIVSDIEIFNNFNSIGKSLEVKFIEKNVNKFNVKGRVDRVDFVLQNGEYTGDYIIHDYKFSSSYTDIKDISELEKMQLSVYRWIMEKDIEDIQGVKPRCIGLLYRPVKTAIKGKRTLHGVVHKDYSKAFGFKGAANLVIEENLNDLYNHLDEAIQEIRLLIKTGKINTIENCSYKEDFMFPCPVGDLCREGI